MSLKKKTQELNQIKVAILDTGFCLEKINFSHPNIEIKPVELATPSFKIHCKTKTLLGRRYHGHYVLEEFLKNLKTTKKIVIYPYVIFDKNGKQKIEYWRKVLSYIDDQQIHLVLSAAGLPLSNQVTKKSLPKLNGLTNFFLAAGKRGVGITKTTELFPQLNNHKDNVVLIGNYFPPIKFDQRFLYDNSMLYKDQTQYFFNGGSHGDEVRGTSRAVAIATALAINICSNKINNIKKCLAEKKKKILLFHQERELQKYSY